MALNLKPLPEFNPDGEVGSSLAARWRLWLSDFNTFLIASGIRDATRKRALLLYQAGSRVREIFHQLDDIGDDADYEIAKDKLTAYFEPQNNRRYEVYKFRQTRQEEGETLDKFHTRLRNLSTNCEFENPDFEIEQQILTGGSSSKIRRRALRDPDYKLKDMLLDGRRDEMSSYQAKDIESKTEETLSTNRFQAQQAKPKAKGQRTCYNCGGAWPHEQRCPAKGKVCRKCNKTDHFASVCRSQNSTKGQTFHRMRGNSTMNKRNQVKPVQHHNDKDNESSSDEYMYAIQHKTMEQKKGCRYIKTKVGGQYVTMMVDTGASINVLDRNTFEKLTNIELKPTKVKAFPFNSKTPINFKGKFETLIESKARYCVATFYVMHEKDTGCLLSGNTALELGIVTFNLNKITDSNGLTVNTKDRAIQAIIGEYKEVFTGLGKLENDAVKLNIDKEAIPQAQPQRRIPFHIRKKVKHAVKELQREDIIEAVPETQPTPWVSPIVAVPKKDGSVRICVDMRMANQAINRVRYPIPTVNDVSLDLNGAKYFSKLDLAQAYHQLPLSEESRYITTFSTHIGLFRYKRLAYGINASAEIFQHALQQSLQGIQGVCNIADDIIIHGKSREEHDAALRNSLKRLQEKGLTLNANKCSFLQPSLEFFGQIFSAEGTRPDPKRIIDLQNMSTPTNAQEVRSLLGMANYSSRYIRNYATITSPLRELTKKNIRFTWTEIHQDAFTKLQDALINAPVMAYFDMSKNTTITVDASPVGISAILAQGTASEDYKVIAYASRALTDVEKRYSQTEKEALSIVWGIEHFHLYLYGKEFTLITDHKPLEIIYGTPTSKPSARIERWVLRLQPYQFVVQYKAGADNPADYLSRHPASNTNQSTMAEETEMYINFVTHNAVPKAMTIDEISEATNADRVLKGLRAAIRTGHWETMKQYKPIKDEITIGCNNIILRGSRIIIPDALHQRAVDIAHESHQGISKTKALLREKVWFFRMDEVVQKTLESCLACQAVGKPSPPAPIQQVEMPSSPWEQVHVDYCGPLPTGEYLLVVIDRYSHFPEVAIVNSTKSSTLFTNLDRIFSVHGIPEIIISDNGPPFNSDEFSRYNLAIGSKHHRITPRWPQANGEVEKFNQPLLKTIQAAVVEGKVWKQELQRFLLQYRTTPHSTTKVPPCELLFNRQIRGKFPILKRKSIINKHKIARENEEKSQKYQKMYIDKKRHAKESDIAIGDTVLVKQQYKNKFSSRFDKAPYKVIQRKGTMITAENRTRRITRNVSHFKKFPARVDQHEEFDSDMEQELNKEGNQAEREHRPGNNARRQSTRVRSQPVRYGDPIPSRFIR